MKVLFLGTGTSIGVPVIGCNCDVCISNNPKDKRLRSSLYIETDNGIRLLIDCGPDFRQQMLQNNITEIDAVLITHAHRDHVAGLDDLRPLFFDGDKIQIFAEEHAIVDIKKVFFYSFTDEKYPGVPVLDLQTINTEPFTVKGEAIIPIRGYHHLLPILGFRIGNFVYLTDINKIPDEELVKLENVEYLVIDALRIKEHISHFNLSQALAEIAKIKPQRAYLTHLSDGMGRFDDVTKLLPENVYLTYDGMVIEC